MEATPENQCGAAPPQGAVVVIGNVQRHNPSMVYKFPHTVISSRARGSVLTVDRTTRGSLAVILEIRSTDGKIIARMERNGFVLNCNNYLEVKKDKSSLIIIDEYGLEVLNVRYLNPQAIAVTGRGIEFPGTSVCLAAGGIDLSVP
jgi:hypothetical protein